MKPIHAATVLCLVTLASCGRTDGHGDPVDINVDLQNRGTVTGTAFINLPYQDPNATYRPVGGAKIRLTTGGVTTIGSTPYQTVSNNSGGFLIEVPAGSYNVYACSRNNDEGWAGSSSATITRGSTVNIGELRLEWQRAYLCAYFPGGG